MSDFQDNNMIQNEPPQATQNAQNEPVVIEPSVNTDQKPADKKINKGVILGILTSLVIFGGFVAYMVTSRNAQDSLENLFPIGKDVINQEDQEKYVNPLTGERTSDVFVIENRPLAVMVNNHENARPQSGLVKADLVYEIVAEGGITRFLAFFLSETPEKIGPVRSARDYYLVLVKELGDAMVMHIGWSPRALEAIETWPVRSLARGGAQFWRDTSLDVATEHTAYVSGPELRELSTTLGWEGKKDFEVWEFKDPKSEQYTDGELAQIIDLDFWYESNYSAHWEYNADINQYLRSTGFENELPKPHVDRESGEQVKVSNLIVQFALEQPILGDDKNRLEYELEGSGEATVFIDGRAIPATWSKESRDDRTLFYDLNGEPIKLNPGKVWISIVSSDLKENLVYSALVQGT